MYSLIQMMQYCRPMDSETETEFCREYLIPVFGSPDKNGNFIKHIGKSPICFMAHYDTVHTEGGYQRLEIDDCTLSLATGSDSACMGADCTTGVWLILEMIKAKVEGTYIIHYGEESGCIGSSAMVRDCPEWLLEKEFAISFDRKGTSEIITHQMGNRTASDAFAESLEAVLNLGLKPSDNGSYTDSNEYRGIISECTNLAVGYYGQHTASESQDLEYLGRLRDSLINADWDSLISEREPEYVSNWWESNEEELEEPNEAMIEIIEAYPFAIALMLKEYGFNEHDLLDELQKHYGI